MMGLMAGTEEGLARSNALVIGWRRGTSHGGHGGDGGHGGYFKRSFQEQSIARDPPENNAFFIERRRGTSHGGHGGHGGYFKHPFREQPIARDPPESKVGRAY